VKKRLGYHVRVPECLMPVNQDCLRGVMEAVFELLVNPQLDFPMVRVMSYFAREA
jgi:hypothetical protein